MKKWQKLLGALLMGVTFGASLPVQAGNIPTNCVPLQTYSFRKVYCYLSPGGQQKGWIDAGDFVIVERIQDNGWAYGSYPAGSTRVKRWFRASDLVANINFANQNRYSPKNNTNVYRNSGYNSTIGSFSGNEAITVVSDNGDSRQVIYKLSNGTGYKMGWVPYWDCWSYDQVNPRATVNTQPKGNPIVTPVTRPEANTSSYGAWKATMNKRATAYMDANLTQRNGNEYADKGDTVTVLDESSKGYYVEYPLTRGGTKKRWVVRTAVTALNVSNNTNNTNNNSTPNAFANGATKAADTIIQNNTQYQQWQGRANCKATAYDNSALTRRLGVEYVSRGDVVTVLGEAGKAYYVEYPLSRGGTKKRWVAKSAIDKYDNSYIPNNNTDITDNWDSMVGKYLANLDSESYKPLQYGKNPFKKSYSHKGIYHATNCTWYAIGRYHEVNGRWLGVTGGPEKWEAQAKQKGFTVGSQPQSKSVGIRPSDTDKTPHVIFVENVSGEYAYITEANAGPSSNTTQKDFYVQKISLKDLKNVRKIIRFIYK